MTFSDKHSLYSDQSRQQHEYYGQASFCNDDGGQYDDGQYDEGNVHSDVEDFSTLVSQPRQVGS